jgi:hypothetical protein
MSRKLEQVDSSSSYDLMLDVLSNVFGGVILISCLLAILPRHVAPPPLLSADLAKQEMTERRIAMAESELDQILIQTQRLEDRTSSELVTALSERVALKKILESLNTELATIRELELKLVDDKVTPMKGTVRRADQQLRNIKTQLIAAEKLNRALKEKLKTIEKEAKDQNSEKGEGEYYYVQLPQEKGALVNPFPIIIRHGKIYPTNVGSALIRNKSLRRTMIDEDVERVIPISSQGWLLTRDVTLLSATLRAAVSEGYSISVYLYPDSYDVFQDFKNELFKAKIRYGVEFLKVGHTMKFSSEGSSPQEL